MTDRPSFHDLLARYVARHACEVHAETASCPHLTPTWDSPWPVSVDPQGVEGAQSDDCTCFVTPEHTWFRYGSAVEPGSQMEPNPDCPYHFPGCAR